MAVQQKRRDATEFEVRPQAIIDELRDPTKNFTVDEIHKRADEVKALKLRAQTLAGFTPEDEIDDQGGEDTLREQNLLRRGTPEGRESPRDADQNGVSRRRQTAFQARQEELRQSITDAFGGMDSFMLAMSYKAEQPLDTRQQKVFDELMKFQKRTIVGTTGDASKAEVLLPLQQVESIFMVENAIEGIFSLARRYVMTGRSIRIPYLKQADGANTRPMAGIANVSYHNEGQEKELREPSYEQRVMEAYKVAAYAELGDEILVDDMTGQLQSSVSGSIGQQILNFGEEQATYDGRGEANDELLGAFHPNNPALYKVIREDANDFTFADAVEMLARHVYGSKSRWFMHTSVMPRLLRMNINGTLVTFQKDISGRPGQQLLGIPVVYTDAAPVLGNQSDVSLGNPDFYASAFRTALTIESSRHFKFRNDITALRMFARMAGIPIPDGTYSYKAAASTKVYEKSPFVTLDDVYAS
jgi:HK97 family phage major capsid protein